MDTRSFQAGGEVATAEPRPETSPPRLLLFDATDWPCARTVYLLDSGGGRATLLPSILPPELSRPAPNDAPSTEPEPPPAVAAYLRSHWRSVRRREPFPASRPADHVGPSASSAITERRPDRAKPTPAPESTDQALPLGTHPTRLRRLALALAACLGVAQAWNEGVSTQFEGVGYPYGACGVPDSIAWNEAGRDTANGQANPFLYVALNVFDAPGDYRAPGDFGRRPLVDADTVHMGMYRNGANCGRWIRARWGDECDGANDGAAGQAFCRNGQGWYADARNDAVVDLLVFDQCSDANAWCRDARYHLDIHTPALDAFRKPGATLPPLATPVRDGSGRLVVDANNPLAVKYSVQGFNNRKVLWEFQRAPNYSGEPHFYFSQGSEKWYKRVIVTHLPNGLHGVEQWDGKAWRKAAMEGDAGQMWILPSPDVMPIRVRLTDADDQPVMAGRTWSMEFPPSCGSKCAASATAAANVRGEGGTVSASPAGSSAAPLAQPVIARRLGAGIAVSLSAGEQGRIEAYDLGGRLLARGAVREGTGWLPALPAGVVLLRWDIGRQAGSARVLVEWGESHAGAMRD